MSYRYTGGDCNQTQLGFFISSAYMNGNLLLLEVRYLPLVQSLSHLGQRHGENAVTENCL